ncbi:hypothetical protein BC833DRAFT_602261 [Globomyces pollinis-pini]|nr:hypothetical protein BC833DRAFT_602261 [Globomyces pollinis-pini]
MSMEPILKWVLLIMTIKAHSITDHIAYQTLSTPCVQALTTHLTSLSQSCFPSHHSFTNTADPDIYCSTLCSDAITNFNSQVVSQCNDQLIFVDDDVTAMGYISQIMYSKTVGCVKSIDGSLQTCLSQQHNKLSGRKYTVTGDSMIDVPQYLTAFPDDACLTCSMLQLNAVNALMVDATIGKEIAKWNEFSRTVCHEKSFIPVNVGSIGGPSTWLSGNSIDAYYGVSAVKHTELHQSNGDVVLSKPQAFPGISSHCANLLNLPHIHVSQHCLNVQDRSDLRQIDAKLSSLDINGICTQTCKDSIVQFKNTMVPFCAREVMGGNVTIAEYISKIEVVVTGACVSQSNGVSVKSCLGDQYRALNDAGYLISPDLPTNLRNLHKLDPKSVCGVCVQNQLQALSALNLAGTVKESMKGLQELVLSECGLVDKVPKMLFLEEIVLKNTEAVKPVTVVNSNSNVQILGVGVMENAKNGALSESYWMGFWTLFMLLI